MKMVLFFIIITFSLNIFGDSDSNPSLKVSVVITKGKITVKDWEKELFKDSFFEDYPDKDNDICSDDDIADFAEKATVVIKKKRTAKAIQYHDISNEESVVDEENILREESETDDEIEFPDIEFIEIDVDDVYELEIVDEKQEEEPDMDSFLYNGNSKKVIRKIKNRRRKRKIR